MTFASLAPLAVVVVNYGSHDLLAANLAPLSRARPELAVVVVDNLSTGAERAAVTRLADAEGWHLELPDGNEGFGTGMNRGVARASAIGRSHVLLLNPDALIAADAVAALLAASLADDDAMVAPRILRPDGSLWSAGSDLYLDDGRIRSRRRRVEGTARRIEPWLSGACLLLSVALFERAGGFDDAYFLYWEDVDLSHRVVAAGGRLALLDEVEAVHAEGGTQGAAGQSAGQAKSPVYYFHNIRNRMLFAARHLDTADLRAWRRNAPRVAWEILLQGGRRQLLASRAPLTAGLRGLRDGDRIARAELRRRAGRG
ncbi:glycosyltransferase family 2 protein [Clavibacter sp. Sh2036]|uniref:glycosyltransferase family 2 protein n=1 Tax=Clavibacter sp. Sh2036 TaxID=3397677 RepID=UPI0039E18D7D